MEQMEQTEQRVWPVSMQTETEQPEQPEQRVWTAPVEAATGQTKRQVWQPLQKQLETVQTGWTQLVSRKRQRQQQERGQQEQVW